MKRSEMLDKLQDVLINLGLKTEYDCGCCQKEATIDEAEAILHFIEYVGMLPPSTTGCGYDDYHQTIYVNDWDPENE